MSFIKWLDNRLTNFTAEAVNKENAHKYENVFYSNNEYYLITDGRPALKEDCMDTVEYTESFTEGTPHCIGFSRDGVPMAFLSLFEGYPDENTLYIGLFLVNKSVQRKSVGTEIMNAVIAEGFALGYTAIRLSVQDNNVSGYPFWQKLGFKETDKTLCQGFYNISMLLNKTKAV